MQISEYLTQDHRDIDDVFAKLEEQVNSKKWDDANASFSEFYKGMDAHFKMEEEIMFPAFEEKTGMTQGPTAVMRMEHTQMRQLMEDLSCDLEKKDKDHFLGVSETLMMLIQQHNSKEEMMLYNMANNVLAVEATDIVTQMKAIAVN